MKTTTLMVSEVHVGRMDIQEDAVCAPVSCLGAEVHLFVSSDGALFSPCLPEFTAQQSPSEPCSEMCAPCCSPSLTGESHGLRPLLTDPWECASVSLMESEKGHWAVSISPRANPEPSAIAWTELPHLGGEG